MVAVRATLSANPLSDVKVISTAPVVGSGIVRKNLLGVMPNPGCGGWETRMWMVVV